MRTAPQDLWVVAGAMTLLLATTGCQQSSDQQAAPEPSTVSAGASSSGGTAAASSPVASPSTAGSAVGSSEAATPTATASSPAAGASTASPSRSGGTPSAGRPQTLSLAEGATATLAHFDVTLLRSTYGKDGVSHGWKVRVCYTHPHPGQNPDGTTRVSTDPWSVRVADMEGDGNVSWVPISDFPADKGWQPPYPQRTLRLGECAEGWIAIKHGNPDLAFSGLRYEPADFGDEVTWKTR